ncbi:MAG: hypothetical protein ACRDSP_23780 [Pseudonocardiaceae bacterium]
MEFPPPEPTSERHRLRWAVALGGLLTGVLAGGLAGGLLVGGLRYDRHRGAGEPRKPPGTER